MVGFSMSDDAQLSQLAYLQGANRAHRTNTRDAYEAIDVANARIQSLNERVMRA
jgi:hypothetical protein